MKPIDKLSDAEWLALVQRAIAMPDAPPELLQGALDLWRQHRSASNPGPLLQRWVAVLSFDSWAGASMTAGMRALPSEVRQLLFAARGCDIDLRITPLADGFALSGQLLWAHGGGSVELIRGGEGSERRNAAVDALGEFRIDDLSSGTYRITVRLGHDEIELPPIDVGPPLSLREP